MAKVTPEYEKLIDKFVAWVFEPKKSMDRYYKAQKKACNDIAELKEDKKIKEECVL